MWHLQRRPQLIEAFDREVYGRVPTSVPHVRWEVTDVTHEKIGAQRALVKHLRGHVNDSAFPTVNVDIEALVAFPEESAKPVPVIMHIGFIKIPPEMQRFAAMDGGKDWREQLLARGWGYLIVVPTSVQADDPAQLTEGIIGLANRGQPRKPDAWGALRAWAWGASRALDYLETDSNADAKRVGTEGLSRYGKAALVAMAYDERFAIGFIGSSGAGGAKLHRRDFGERVENLAGVGAYHWMAGNYMKYAGPLTAKDLPVDAHELIALCAPRPYSSASVRVRLKVNGSTHAACSWRPLPQVPSTVYSANAISAPTFSRRWRLRSSTANLRFASIPAAIRPGRTGRRSFALLLSISSSASRLRSGAKETKP